MNLQNNSNTQNTNLSNTTDKSKNITITMKNLLLKYLYDYSFSQVKKKSDYISQNLTIINSLNCNKPQVKKLKNLNINLRNKIQHKVMFQKSLTMPRGLFTFFVKSSYRTPNRLKLEFIPFFEDKTYFEDVMLVVNNDFKLNYIEIPQTKGESESINNVNFILYVFSKYLLENIKDFKETPALLSELIYLFSKLLMKKTQLVYDIFMKFFKNFELKPKFRFNGFSSVSKYRDNFCNICKKYLCNTHFNKHITLKDHNERLGIHFYEEVTEKLSLAKKFILRSNEIKNDIKLKSCQLNKRYNCYLLNDVVDYENMQNLLKNMSQENLYVIYKVYTLLKSEAKENISCFISNILPNVNCSNIRSAIEFMNQKPTLITSFKDNLTQYIIPKIKLEEQKTNTNNLKCQVQERDSIPCNHSEICSKDNCICYHNKYNI